MRGDLHRFGLIVVALAALSEPDIAETGIRSLEVCCAVAADAQPVKSLARVQIIAFPVIGVCRVAFVLVAGVAFLKLSPDRFILD